MQDTENVYPWLCQNSEMNVGFQEYVIMIISRTIQITCKGQGG